MEHSPTKLKSLSYQEKANNIIEKENNDAQKDKQLLNSFYSCQKIPINKQLRMVKEQQFQDILHMNIGLLVFDVEGQDRQIGTGFLISKNLVLTAAHNIVHNNYSPNRLSRNVKFYLAARKQIDIRSDFYRVQQGSWRYLNQYKFIKGGCLYDYALLKLVQRIDRPIRNKGYLPLFIQCNQCKVDLEKDYKSIRIYGYPSYKDNLEPKKEWTLTINQYGQSSIDHIFEIIPNEGKIKYMTPTLGGQSGCPVYSNSGVVAVHVGSGKKTGENFNIGRLITSDVVANLQKWRIQLRGDSFQINGQRLCEHQYNQRIIFSLIDKQQKKNEEEDQRRKEDLQKIKKRQEQNKRLQQQINKKKEREEQFRMWQLQARKRKQREEQIRRLQQAIKKQEREEKFRRLQQQAKNKRQLEEQIRGLQLLARKCKESEEQFKRLYQQAKNKREWEEQIRGLQLLARKCKESEEQFRRLQLQEIKCKDREEQFRRLYLQARKKKEREEQNKRFQRRLEMLKIKPETELYLYDNALVQTIFLTKR